MTHLFLVFSFEVLMLIRFGYFSNHKIKDVYMSWLL